MSLVKLAKQSSRSTMPNGAAKLERLYSGELVTLI